MRRFQLDRRVDETGISGTGIIAEGVEFSNGWVAVVWLTEHRSLVMYPEGMAEVVAIHGHGGKTRVRWIDTEAGERAARGLAASEANLLGMTLDELASLAVVPGPLSDAARRQYEEAQEIIRRQTRPRPGEERAALEPSAGSDG